MIRIISALLISFFSVSAFAQETKPIELADNAPDRHIVVKGDTLWDISAKFLKSPWRWPEVWRLNKDQIHNPHLIYPGQVVVLDMIDGVPRLRLANQVGGTIKLRPKVYVQQDLSQIPSIPQNVIEPFLSRPLIVAENEMAQAPKIIATVEDRVYVGSGDIAYVTGLTDPTKNWFVYRPAKPLTDPETNTVIGYEAYYLGSAQKTRDGEPATIEISTAKEEIGPGDLLAQALQPEIISYAPHAPNTQIHGRVVSVYGGVTEGGRHSIITLNKGKQDGLEVGHVLALYRAGVSKVYWDEVENKKTVYQLPDERYGLIFVFRTFDHISYALVMNVTRPVDIADAVRTP